MLKQPATNPTPRPPTEPRPCPAGPRGTCLLSGLVGAGGLASPAQHLLEVAGKVLRACWGGIGLTSPEGELVELDLWSVPDQTLGALEQDPGLLPFLQRIAEQPGAVRWEERAADVPLPAGLPPFGSLLARPVAVLAQGRCAIFLARPADAPPFEPADEEALAALCAWPSHERLFESAHLLARLQLLNQVAQAAAGSLDLTRILSVVFTELDRHLPLHVTAVWLIEDNEKQARAGGVRPLSNEKQAGAGGVRPPAPVVSLVLADAGEAANQRAARLGLTPGLRLAPEQAPFASCLAGEPALHADLTALTEEDAPLGRQLAAQGARAFFAVPLRAGSQTLGVLQSVCTRPAGFTAEQVQLLYLVADLLGPAVASCRLYGRLRDAYEKLRLTQDQLIQAEKLRAVGELAAGMAHDFNNALGGVVGFLELALADQGLPPACRSHLESSRTCALDAAQTVRRVQDFTRWQRNQRANQLIDLDELVRQTVELARPKWQRLAQTQGTPFTVQVHLESAGRVRGDAGELREALTNLVFNAVDAMPQGGKSMCAPGARRRTYSCRSRTAASA